MVAKVARFRLTDAERGAYRRYAGLALPRHTSYPTVPAWKESYGPAEFRADLASASGALSLYVHVPFCEQLCYYCACTKEIVPAGKRRRGDDPSDALLAGLAAEADRLARFVECRTVRQIHLGGGTPTFLSPGHLERLWELLRRRFDIAPDAEAAVEVDPRVTTYEHLATLRGLGCGRVSLGIQDFAPRVQRAVHRWQPFGLVEQSVGWCRELGFTSINFDLIYGLPFQTPETMADTLEKTIALAPDRVAVYRLALIPDIFRWQQAFRPSDLPAGDLPLDLNLLAINRFLEAGYEYIGLDHFARPGEALARARVEGTLRRNFQGMTTGKDLDILGLGPSAISQLDAACAQSRKQTAAWQQALAEDLATERGLRLTPDDRIRRELLQQLYGYGTIDKRSLEERFGIVFDDYFAPELGRLAVLIDHGLVRVEGGLVRVTDVLGRLLARVVAAVFDRYLPADAFREGLPARRSSAVG